MKVCICIGALRQHSSALMNDKHLPSYESIFVDPLYSNTHCVCVLSGRAEFQSHAILMTDPWAKYGAGFTLQRIDLLDPKVEKNHLNNCQSVFACEKSSW